jgi:hypothetical protein
MPEEPINYEVPVEEQPVVQETPPEEVPEWAQLLKEELQSTKKEVADVKSEAAYWRGRAEGGSTIKDDPRVPQTQREWDMLSQGASVAAQLAQNPEDEAAREQALNFYNQANSAYRAVKPRFEEQEQEQRRKDEDFRFMIRDAKVAPGSQDHRLLRTLHEAGWEQDAMQAILEERRNIAQQAGQTMAASRTSETQAARTAIEGGEVAASPRLEAAANELTPAEAQEKSIEEYYAQYGGNLDAKLFDTGSEQAS